MENPEKIMDRITGKLNQDKPVHVKLPDGGVFNMDSPVPFLLVYRIPPGGEDQFTLQLGKTEAAYLMTGESSGIADLLVSMLSKDLSDRFGAFLLLEVWVTDRHDAADFTIHIDHEGAKSIAESLQSALGTIRIGRTRLNTVLLENTSPAPPYYSSLLDKKQAKRSKSILTGLEIKPVYINPERK